MDSIEDSNIGVWRREGVHAHARMHLLSVVLNYHGKSSMSESSTFSKQLGVMFRK